MSSSAAAATGIHYPRFTASQWQELEHQALIFKYMMAGIPVPSDLLHPIRRSIESSRFFHHPSLNYCSFYGKKIDPEPGRCRRTDGKKWRCSKDAYPDSKYCERHMHRGRNRSRKPVEMPNISQSSSTVAPLAVATGGTGTLPSNFSNLPLHPISNSQGSHTSQLQIDPASYGFGNRNFRYLQATKGEADEHSFFSEASGSARRLGLDSPVDGTWSLMSYDMSSLPQAKNRNISIWESNHQQIQGLQNDLEPVNTAMSKQQQHCIFGTQFGSPKPVKHESLSLRPFFDEWPRNRESWANSQDERSSGTSLTTTQLSMSIPVGSSDFPANASESPSDD